MAFAVDTKTTSAPGVPAAVALDISGLRSVSSSVAGEVRKLDTTPEEYFIRQPHAIFAGANLSNSQEGFIYLRSIANEEYIAPANLNNLEFGKTSSLIGEIVRGALGTLLEIGAGGGMFGVGTAFEIEGQVRRAVTRTDREANQRVAA